MIYRYTDGYITVSKQKAFKAFKSGKDVRIGYQHKDDGAYWNFNQFRNEMRGDTAKENFESVVYYIQHRIIPHTRLKYAIKEEI